MKISDVTGFIREIKLAGQTFCIYSFVAAVVSLSLVVCH